MSLRRAVALLALGGCGDASDPGPAADASVPVDAATLDHLCSEAEPSLTPGQGHPFEPAGDPPTYPIQTGGQGAFHIEISLRADGRIDPDHADLRVKLTRGEWVLSEGGGKNLLLSWLGGVCSYDKLRLVLLSEDGGVLPQDRLGELVAAPARLEAEMCTGTSCGRWEGEIVLTPFLE